MLEQMSFCERIPPGRDVGNSHDMCGSASQYDKGSGGYKVPVLAATYTSRMDPSRSYVAARRLLGAARISKSGLA
jgi:hypothetical protein